MINKTLLLFLTLVIFQSAQAANKYVRAGASGNGNDWTNALPSLPSSLTRGDTYYVASGSYNGRSFKDAVSGTKAITIKKATGGDHGTEAGWKESYGTGAATFDGQLAFNSSYYVFDGSEGGGPTAWGKGFGFKVTETGDSTAVISVGNGTAGDNISIRHTELVGKGRAGTGGGNLGNDGVAIYGHSNITVSYCYIHETGRCPFFVSPSNLVVEYSQIGKFYGSEAVHSEVASIWAFISKMGDVTFRYNLFTYVYSTGGLMFDNSSNPSCHLYVYGNVFYESSPWQEANGVIGGWTGGGGEKFYNALVYNNSFVTVDQAVLSNFPNIHGGCVAKNNLWYSCAGENFDIFEHDFNHFINSGGTYGEKHGSSGSGDPFVDYKNLNFALKSDTPPGDSSVPAQYRTDMFGNVGLTRGAVQFSSSSPTPTPEPTATPEPTPTPEPSVTPEPSPTPGSATFEDWIKEQNNWIRKHPPYPDNKN